MVLLVHFLQPSNQRVQTCWDHNGVDMKGGFHFIFEDIFQKSF